MPDFHPSEYDDQVFPELFQNKRQECAFAYPTEPDTNIRAGDKVRSYDFPGRVDCYVEGTVEGFVERDGCQRYVIAVDRRVLEGRNVSLAHRDPYQVFPPVNGTGTTFGGTCRGVVKL